jgi:hypothetical protein
MKNYKKYLSVAIVLLAAGSCELYKVPEIAKPTPGKDLDFAKMVSIGNSLTAGFMGGALYTNSQNNSYPNRIAEQMKLVGGGIFNQPTVNSTNGCFNPSGGCTQGRLKLKLVGSPPSPSPVPTAGDGGVSLAPIPAASKTTLNNFGVPGVTLQTALIAATGGPAASNPAYNPYYARIASNPSVDGISGSTLVGDAAAALANGGTFFTFWLGNNDVLGYATGGASNPALLTSQTNFSARLTTALNAMLNAKADAEGAVANIPDVTTIPYFTTVAYNPIVFLSSNPVHVGTVAALNAPTAYGGFNAALDGLAAASVITTSEAAKRKVIFKTGATSTSGANAAVIVDESLADLGPALSAINPALASFAKVRQATAADKLTLTAASVLPLGQGVSTPLADQYVLIPSELTEIQAAIDGFNSSIASAVAANSGRLVLVNVNSALKLLATTAVTLNGSSLTASISPPSGGFSLDGVHPNARGSAYIANLFIQAINEKWGSTIPLCNPNDFAGNELPTP